MLNLPSIKCHLLLKPVLLDRSPGRLASGCLAFNFDLLCLIDLQLFCKRRFCSLGAHRRGGSGPFLDLTLTVGSLGGGRLIGFQFAEIDLLDQVGCWEVRVSCGEVKKLKGRGPTLTGRSRCDERAGEFGLLADQAAGQGGALV